MLPRLGKCVNAETALLSLHLLTWKTIKGMVKGLEVDRFIATLPTVNGILNSISIACKQRGPLQR